MIPIIIVTLSQNSLLKPQIGSDNIGPLPYHFNLRFNFNTYLVSQETQKHLQITKSTTLD